MRVFKKFLKAAYCLLVIICAFTLVAGVYYGTTIDGNFKITKGSSLAINTLIPVTAVYENATDQNAQIGEKVDISFKMFGIIPVKRASVEVVDQMFVAVLGTPFGMKMYTDGVYVTELSAVICEKGSVCPAGEAGIKKGDYIKCVNGQKVETNEDLSDIIQNCGGSSVRFVINRNGEEITVSLTPVLSSQDNSYKAGIWVKDSSAGIGTLTFYSPYSNIVCGLGHAVYDNDTGDILQLSRGNLVGAEIVSVVKGNSGAPGELKGKLDYNIIANSINNFENGIYGDCTCNIDTTSLTEVALKQNVKNGDATILCTVDDGGVKAYSCKVKVKDINVNDTEQNLIVEITDQELLSKTGGIVQGMSGSPLIQNGKLIGAVTHVLVDDPTKGYAIFAENMLETAQSVSQEQIKEAS